MIDFIREIRKRPGQALIEYYEIRIAQSFMVQLNQIKLHNRRIEISFDRPRTPDRSSSSDALEIKEEEELNSRRWPITYTELALQRFLDEHCDQCNRKKAEDEDPSSYDHIFIPTDRTTGRHKRYAFVRMSSPIAVLRLFRAHNNKTWPDRDSNKICLIKYAMKQV